jgi:hypothetical protein
MHPLNEFYESSSLIYIQDKQDFGILNCLPAEVMRPARIVDFYVKLSTIQT